MVQLVNDMGAAGIYTLVDFHQDVLSRYFCGEGIPDWAVTYGRPVKPFPEPVAQPYAVDDKGYPDLATCLNKSFATYYPTNAAGAAFQALYDNTNGLQDSFSEYWLTVVAAFRGNPYVVGYELINEPWFGDVNTRSKLLLPGEADRVNLQPLYSRLHSDIRSVDNSHMLFYERCVGDAIFPSGLTQGPGVESV